MDRKMKLEFLLEHLEEEAGYLSQLCEDAKKNLANNLEFNFLYGYVSEEVNYHGKKIKELVESLKKLLYEGSDYDKD